MGSLLAAAGCRGMFARRLHLVHLEDLNCTPKGVVLSFFLLHGQSEL